MPRPIRSIFAVFAVSLLLTACASNAKSPVAAWAGDRDSVVSARLWCDGREVVFDDRETIDALLDVVGGFLFHAVSEKDANAPGAQHTSVTLVYRDGTEERITFPVWIREDGAYDAGADSVQSFAPFLDRVPDAYASGGSVHVFENEGTALSIPAEYAALVRVETPQDDTDGVLFTVTETASAEAAEADGHADWGMGWLFSIARLDEAALDELMCADIPGTEVFAKDGDGHHYMFCHPTDVRLYRQDDAFEAGWEQWEKLCSWSYEDVCNAFLAENPHLHPETRTSSGVDIYLARLVCYNDLEYTLSTTAFGPLTPEGVDPAPYLARLRDGVTFETVDPGETPDGEYVALFFPDEGGGERFDFFRMEGRENYVRQVYGVHGEYEILYKASYADSATKASDIMEEWYFALAKAHGLLP